MFALRVPTKTVSLDFNEITAYFAAHTAADSHVSAP